MASEHTKIFRPGPASRGGRRLAAGAIASLALVLTGAAAGPADAAVIPITPVQGEVVTIGAHSSNESRAICPAGQTAVSGGWYAGVGAVPGVSQQYATNRTGDTWRVIFDNPTDFAVSGWAIAYCSPA